MLGDVPWKTEPQFTNAEGVKWWVDKDSNSYVKRKGFDTNKVNVWYVERPDGYKTRIIIENGEMVYESQQLEAIAVHIDVMALNRDMSDG